MQKGYVIRFFIVGQNFAPCYLLERNVSFSSSENIRNYGVIYSVKLKTRENN
jgi:hypothetical protein